MARKRKKIRNPKAVVGYCRVSTEDQTVEQQETALKAWCRSRGFDLVAVYSEIGVSGGADLEKRSGLLEAINGLDLHNAATFLAVRRDRVARDVVKAAMINKLVADQGSKLITTDGIGEDDSPAGVMFGQIVDVFSQYEKAIIKLRTVTKLNEKRLRGELTGQPPIGSEVGPDGKTLVPNAAESEALAIIQSLYAKGASIRSIAASLNEQGIAARGKRWYPTTVTRTLERLKKRKKDNNDRENQSNKYSAA